MRLMCQGWLPSLDRLASLTLSLASRPSLSEIADGLITKPHVHAVMTQGSREV